MVAILCLVQMMTCLFLTVRSLYKETYTSIELDKVPINKPNKSANAGLMLDCIHTCMMLSGCLSVSFNRTSAVCHLYDTPVYVKTDHAKSLMYASLRQTADDQPNRNSITWNVSGRLVVLMKKNTSWRKSKSDCYRLMGGCLHVIDSDIKQAMAVMMLNQSELEYVAIGVSYNVVKKTWRDTCKQCNFNYSAWAEGEPRWPGTYAALSRKSGYRWENIIQRRVDGALCEKGI